MPLIDPKDRHLYLLGFKIAVDFGLTIAVPLVFFVSLGAWLDGRYGYSPRLTIGAFVLSALLSGKLIYKKAKVYGHIYQRDIE